MCASSRICLGPLKVVFDEKQVLLEVQNDVGETPKARSEFQVVRKANNVTALENKVNTVRIFLGMVYNAARVNDVVRTPPIFFTSGMYQIKVVAHVCSY